MKCLTALLALTLSYGCGGQQAANQVSITPASATLRPSETQQFTATIWGTSNSAVTWSVNGVLGGNRTLGTVSPTGRYIAPATLSNAHSVTVAVTNMADPTSSGMAMIELEPTTAITPANQVSVTPAVAAVQTSATQQFTARVLGKSDSAVNWSVNGVLGGKATLGTISPTGLYIAPATLSTLHAVSVSATSLADPANSGTAVINLESLVSVTPTNNYYVNGVTGDDNYDGRSASHLVGTSGPWRTLHKAALTVTAGATVHVADGIYQVNGTVGSTTSIETKHSGTPNSWITYVSDNKWGAKIVNTNSVYSLDNIAWVVEGDYQTVEGFDISGGPYTGIFVDGNHVQLLGNHLHDISSASCVDGSFIYVNSPYQYVDAIGNVIHDGGMKPWPSDCDNWHGIYYGGVTNGPVLYGRILNNIIYRVSGYGIHFWHKVSHIDVLNNLVFYNVHGGIIVGASDGSVNDYFNISNNMVIYNSSMFDNSGGPASLGWGISQYVNGGTIGTHNTYHNNLLYENHASNGWGGNWSNQADGTAPSGTISGTIAADPLLTNYQNSPAVPGISHETIVFPKADYHPNSISPAKSAADCSITPPSNIDGAARLQSEACDIGPY